MARDRQQAKQRQAERRARRLAQQKGDGKQDAGPTPDREAPRADEREDAPGIDPDLAAGAPPQSEGRSDGVLHDDPEFDEDDDEHLTEEEIEAEEEAEEELAARGEEGFEVRGRRGGSQGRGNTRTAPVSYSS